MDRGGCNRVKKGLWILGRYSDTEGYFEGEERLLEDVIWFDRIGLYRMMVIK